jgi:F0F1-type ATP synthase membrane subunit a
MGGRGVYALPLADWISEHLLGYHGVNWEHFADKVTWVPFFCAFLLLFVFKFIVKIDTKFSVVFAFILGAIMCLVEVSHLNHTHAGQGFLGFLGFSWHIFYIWFASALCIFLGVTAASDNGEIPGRFRLLIEMMMEFVRDQIVRPIMGKDGDQYLPFILSFFFIILISNLLGLTPSSTTSTGSIWVTTALASMSFLFYHGCGVKKFGLMQHFLNIVPVHCDMKRLVAFVIYTAGLIIANGALGTPALANEAGVIVTKALPWLTTGKLVIAVFAGLTLIGSFNVKTIGEIVLWLFMLVVELVGTFAKPFALAVRLFANMTGGHAVLYVMFGFGFVFKSYLIAAFVSVPASTAILFLELMVAAIQAYVFTMLTTVFLQAAVHPEH